MITNDELDIIARTRSEVIEKKDLTGENLFLAWGYPTAFVLLLEFAALMWLNEDWSAWLWMGIPLIGTPLMIFFYYCPLNIEVPIPTLCNTGVGILSCL